MGKMGNGTQKRNVSLPYQEKCFSIFSDFLVVFLSIYCFFFFNEKRAPQPLDWMEFLKLHSQYLSRLKHLNISLIHYFLVYFLGCHLNLSVILKWSKLPFPDLQLKGF
jgi:hypothetical protein